MRSRALFDVAAVIGAASAIGGLATLHYNLLNMAVSSMAMFAGAFVVFVSLAPYVWQARNRARAGELSMMKLWTVVVAYMIGLVSSVTALLFSLP